MKEFTHEVKVAWVNTGRQNEIYNWCEENIGRKNLDWGMNGVIAFSTGEHIYHFTKESDAVFFKLKWA